jgi:hypothetical protein
MGKDAYEDSGDEKAETLNENTEEENEEQQKEALPLSKPVSKRGGGGGAKANAPVFDAQKDDLCIAVRTFFEQDGFINDQITRAATIMLDDGNEVAVGKMLYGLRMRFRAPNHTPLIKSRLEALQDLELLQSFLNKTAITKQRPNASSTQLVAIIREKLHDTQSKTLHAECELASCMLEVAKQDLALFQRNAKRQKYF